MREILYCTAGLTAFGVIKDEVVERKGFVIKAKRIFTIQAAPSPSRVMSPRQVSMDYLVAVYDNVEVACDIICDLKPESPLYRGIVEGLEVGEKGGKTIQ
jgi:hypothetical protein